jgi:hypothetical protein
MPMSNAAPQIRSVWPYQQQDDAIPFPRVRRAKASERSIGLRGATQFRVLVCEGPHAAHCHALELSASGIVVERGRELSERECRAGFKLELFLPELERPVRVLAKVVRPVTRTAYAFKFVFIADVDRLTLMEHLDLEQRDSLRLLDEVQHAGAA